MVPTLVSAKGLCHIYLMPRRRTIPATPAAQQATLVPALLAIPRMVGLVGGLLISLIAHPAFADGMAEAQTSLLQALQLISGDRMLTDIRTLSATGVQRTADRHS